MALGAGGLLAGAPAANAALGETTTIAGGTFGFADGTGLGSSSTSQFNAPSGIAVGADGILYVADASNHRIRKVNPTTGQTTTLAGNGTRGYVDGTGGPNGTTQFSVPIGIAVDANGTVFVADRSNNRIRKIAPDGTTTTLAGNGTAGFVDGTGGPSGTTQFKSPNGVAVDAGGNVYVADTQNNRIRKIAANGTTTTLAGGAGFDVDGTGGPTGTARFDGPSLIAIDSGGSLYVPDIFSNRIRKINAATGQTTTLAGAGRGYIDGTGGRSGTTKFSGPNGVGVDVSGNVYVADSGNNRIRKIAPDGTTTTLTGNGTTGYVDGTGGPTGTTEFFHPFGLGVDANGNIYVADTNNHRIRKIELQQLTVTPNTANVIAPSTTLTINGFGFSTTPTNNTVTLSSGTGIVTAATATQLTLTSVTGLTLGALTASVTTSSQSSGTPVQVATVVTGPAALMNATTGTTPQSALVSSAFTNPLSVTVTDAAGNPVTGVTVTFTAPSSGASGVFSNSTPTITDLTNTTGVVSVPFTANSTGGSYTVTAVVTSPTGIANVDFTLTNTKNSQTINYTSATPTPRAGDTYTPTANATSGLTVAFTVDPSSSSVCTLTAGVVSLTSAGTCTINANQPGNQTFLPATQVQQTITVNAAPTTTTTAPTLSTPTTTTTTTTAPQLAFPALTASTPSPTQTPTSNTGSSTGSSTGTGGNTGGTATGATTTTTPAANTPTGSTNNTGSTGSTSTNGAAGAAGAVTTTTQPASAQASAPSSAGDTAKQFDPAGVFTINFAPGSTTLSKTSKTTITNVAKTYQTLPAGTEIVISGHTTKVATKTERNLATKRANTVAKALKTALGKTATTKGFRFTVDTKTDNPTKPTTTQTNRITIQTTK